MPFFIKPVARGIADQIRKGYAGPATDLHLGFVERTLSERPYFAGSEFSIADIQMFYGVEAGLSRHEGECPHMRAWRERQVAPRTNVQRPKAAQQFRLHDDSGSHS